MSGDMSNNPDAASSSVPNEPKNLGPKKPAINDEKVI